MRSIILSLAMFGLILSPFSVSAETIADRVAGHILLQVEDHGESWYVNPNDGFRYYMKDGPTAYQMMREFGLGISEEDFSVIETDEALNERLRGLIVLRVNLHGEAYYIHPDDGSIHYLQNGEAAYSIMRYLSLGITNSDLAFIETSELAVPIVAGVTTETASPTIIYVSQPSSDSLWTPAVIPEPEPIIDIEGEIESIIDQIEAGDSYKALDVWYAINGEVFDQARADWLYWTGCNSANYNDSMGWDCYNKVDQLNIQIFPLFKSGCFDYQLPCLSTFDYVDQESYPDWDDLVMSPLKTTYEDLEWDRTVYMAESGYNEALSALITWRQNLLYPTLIEEWHFDYPVFDDVETGLRESLF